MLPQCARKSSESACCDPGGFPIAGAQIRLVPARDPVPGKLESDKHGNLSLNLKAGGYALVVSAPGFKSWSERIYLKAEGAADTPQHYPVVLDIGTIGSPTAVYPEGSLVLSNDG